jgi:hypothetical protein
MFFYVCQIKSGTLSMRLQHRTHLLWVELVTVVECIKGISEGLPTTWAKVALAPFTSFSVFMGLVVAA